jgi:hypothetical protein
MRSTVYEARHRTAKALRLAHVLTTHGATAASVAVLPPEGRAMAVELAGVRPPSEATWAVVEQLLLDREDRRPVLPVNREALVG